MYIANRDGSVSCVKIGYGTVNGVRFLISLSIYSQYCAAKRNLICATRRQCAADTELSVTPFGL